MEIIGSDALTYMIYDKESLYIFDHFNTEHKNGSDQKRVNVRFFHEKKWNIKKIFFYKSPQNDHFLIARYSFPNGNKK